MTEVQWLASDDADAMLRSVRSRMSDRKLRLFACGCCRLAWDRIVWPELREAVQYGEEFADDISDRIVTGAHDAEVVRTKAQSPEEKTVACMARLCCTRPQVGMFHRDWPGQLGPAAKLLLGKTAADLVRDVVGSPFTRPVLRKTYTEETVCQLATMRSDWITPVVLSIAEEIYQTRQFKELPVLADAMEDAGCTLLTVLEHLRSPGPHCRGCWALDLIVGRS